MRPVSAFFSFVACSLVVLGGPAADEPGYNKTDTFEPGKKYTCIPSADRKGWNCNEAGKAQLPASDNSVAPSSSAATIEEAPRAPAPPPSRTSTLPTYLTNAAAQNAAPPAAPPSTISATANHANSPAADSLESHPSRPEPTATPATAKPAPAAHTLTAKPAAPARSAPAPKPHEQARDGGSFMELAGDRFVIELAHASKASSLAELRAAIHVPRGEVYELHLRQNGTDAWLLLWGPFENVDAARAARIELGRSTSTALGFPRRVAPLQTEARRVSEP